MTTRTVPTLPPDPSLLTRIRVGWASMRVAMDEPGNPEAGATINDCFELEVYERWAARLRETPGGRALLDDRPSLEAKDLDLEHLRALPEGTLGRAFAHLYDREGVEPFETRQRIETDAEYLSKRYRETHDLYHLVTGYDTDLLGEMELQAFVAGNLGMRAPRMIVPTGFVMGLLRLNYMDGQAEPTPFHALDWLRRFRAARRRGAEAPPFLAFRFEDHWDEPLDQVRSRLFDRSGDAPAR